MAKKCVRQVRAKQRDLLNQLANVLDPFLPLTSYAENTITFTTIFAESGVEEYLRGFKVKVQALENGVTEVYRRHQRLPWTLIRKIIPSSISYRLHMRNPLTNKEIQNLSQILFDLGIDMRKELSEIEIDESLPRITIPPSILEKHLRNHDLDAHISVGPLQLFTDGHFNESVRKAAEKLENHVIEISGLDRTGRDLMSHAFSDNRHIDLTNVKSTNQQGFSDGFKLLAMGSMAAIRNVFSHRDEETRSPEECFEMLMFINWLFRNIKA